jgi:hypothetical protein
VIDKVGTREGIQSRDRGTTYSESKGEGAPEDRRDSFAREIHIEYDKNFWEARRRENL